MHENLRKALRLLLCIILSGFISFVVVIIAGKYGAEIEKKVFTLDDFAVYDACVSEDGKTIYTTGIDSQFTLELRRQYVKKIVLTFDKMPENWRLQVFYSKFGNTFTEEQSVIVNCSEYSKKISIPIDESVSCIRIDFGDEAGAEFSVPDIAVFGERTNTVPAGKVESLLLMPVLDADGKDWLACVFLFAVLLVIAYLAVCKGNKDTVGRSYAIIFCLALLSVMITTEKKHIEKLFAAQTNSTANMVVDAYETQYESDLSFTKISNDVSSLLSYRLFGITRTDTVLRGKNNWLFYTGDNNIDIAKASYPMTEKNYGETADILAKTSDYLKTKNIDFVFISTCAKVSIYPEYLYGNYEIIDTPTTLLKNAVEERGSVKFVYLKDALLKSKEESILYYPCDTHWNDVGIYKGYSQIYAEMSEWGLLSGEMPEYDIGSKYYECDLNSMLGSKYVIPATHTIAINIKNAKAVEVEDGGENISLLELASAGGAYEVVHYINENNEGKRILYFGSSFSTGANISLVSLLAENSKEVLYIWSAAISREIIETYEPELIIYELGERSIQYTESMFSSYLANCIEKGG